MTDFCPDGLLENERLRNYYIQRVLDLIISDPSGAYAPPGAIYLDDVGEQGTIRTDTKAKDRYGFAYADTLILWNVNQVCVPGHAVSLTASPSISASCTLAVEALTARRANNPLRKWNEPADGRLEKWPK
jgi:hypothetical protein